MRNKQTLGLMLALSVLGAATSVQAGPVGSGLAHTEAHAARRAAEKSQMVHLVTTSRDCTAGVVAALNRHEAVKDVSVDSSGLLIKVSTDPATARTGRLEALAAEACPAAVPAKS